MNIIGRMKIWFFLSGITILAGILALIIFKPHFGIDFTGGSLLELQLPNSITKDSVTSAFTEKNISVSSVTTAGEGIVLVKTKAITESEKNTALATIKSKAVQQSGEVVERQFETIGPTVSGDLIRKAIISVVLASLAIIAYIAFAFRKLPDSRQSWRFGTTAVIALVHDLLFTVGIFAIAGHFFGWEIDSLFITALLTVMGFSVHDTIVVFDRLRENLRRYAEHDFSTIANESVVQTLGRSINTSMTILITLAALLFLGGDTIRGFVFTLFIGMLVGTYSSIFVATPLLVVWQNYIDKKRTQNK